MVLLSSLMSIMVTTQIHKKTITFMLVVYCVTHKTNLPMQTFLKQPLVQKLERLLHLHIHFFFLHPKGTLSNANLLNR